MQYNDREVEINRVGGFCSGGQTFIAYYQFRCFLAKALPYRTEGDLVRRFKMLLRNTTATQAPLYPTLSQPDSRNFLIM
jgi:hypothetical protein